MPGPYGVTSTGFNPKPLQEIKSDLEASFRVAFGNGVDLSADAIFGQLIGIFADRMADAWQGLQGSYNAAFPDTASGVGLDRVSAITGIARKPATSTLVDVVVTGTPGTPVPAGFTASVLGAGTKFKSIVNLNIPGGGTLAIQLVGIVTGPLLAPAGTLTVIETPVAGVVSVVNPLDQVIIGTDLETDGALRVRRELSLRAIGAASSEAIKAGVAEISGVTSVGIFENTTDATIDSVPPHAFEVVVLGGLDQSIVNVIFARKPAGIATYGTSNIAALDQYGNTHPVKFSRPTTIPVYVTVDMIIDGRASDDTGTLVKAAIASWGDSNLRVGSALAAQSIVPSVFSAGPGILDCSIPKIGLSVSPTLSTTLSATPRQILDLDTSRVVVNITRA